MLIYAVQELSVIGVFDANVPNSERIEIIANEDVDLSGFAILLAHSAGDSFYPISDHFYWFGSATVKAGSSVAVYTGPGTNSVATLADNTTRHVFYWGRQQTIFNDTRLKAILFSIGSMTPADVIRTSYPQSAAAKSLPDAGVLLRALRSSTEK